MKTIKDALKELVVVFGGAENTKAVKGDKITEILKKLKEAIVSNGAAEKELLCVNVAIDMNNSVTADKTYSEIETAIFAGKPVFVNISIESAGPIKHRTADIDYTTYEGAISGDIRFVSVYNSPGSGASMIQVSVDSSNTWTKTA